MLNDINDRDWLHVHCNARQDNLRPATIVLNVPRGLSVQQMQRHAPHARSILSQDWGLAHALPVRVALPLLP